MRVSTQMFSNNYVSNLLAHQGRLFNTQQQVATGKRLLTASDDPTGAQQATGLHALLDATTQYQTNASDARTFVESGYALAQGSFRIAQDAMKLTVRAASDSITPDGRKALAATVDQMLEEAFDLSNEHGLGRYTMGGTASGTPPFVATRNAQGQITGVNIQAGAVGGVVNRQLDETSVLKVNLNGPDMYGGTGSPAGSVDYFSTLIQLRDALAANDADTVRSMVPQFQKLLDQVQGQVTLGDARVQRIDNIQKKLEAQSMRILGAISTIEDVDVAQAAVQLQSEQAIYQQALAIGNRILTLGLGSLLG